MYSVSWNKYSDTHTIQPKEEERKRENNQFVYAVLQISFDAWDKTFNNKIKRRTLNGKINDNHVLWVIREDIGMRKAKQDKLHLRSWRKNPAPKKDKIPTWVDLNAKLQKQVTQISEYVEGWKQSHGWTE